MSDTPDEIAEPAADAEPGDEVVDETVGQATSAWSTRLFTPAELRKTYQLSDDETFTVTASYWLAATQTRQLELIQQQIDAKAETCCRR